MVSVPQASASHHCCQFGDSFALPAKVIEASRRKRYLIVVRVNYIITAAVDGKKCVRLNFATTSLCHEQPKKLSCVAQDGPIADESRRK